MKKKIVLVFALVAAALGFSLSSSIPAQAVATQCYTYTPNAWGPYHVRCTSGASTDQFAAAVICQNWYGHTVFDQGPWVTVASARNGVQSSAYCPGSSYSIVSKGIAKNPS